MSERYIRRRARLWRTSHIMARGDRRENIVRDDEDRKRILTTLGDACGRTEFIVHAYVLLPNH